MPAETVWDGFFSPAEIFRKLGLGKVARSVLDAGSGYGTYSISGSKIVRGCVIALDIEREMIRFLEE